MLNSKEIIGKKLKEERIRGGYTLQSVADALHTCTSNIYTYEEDGISDIENIGKICAFLKIDIHKIIDSSFEYPQIIKAKGYDIIESYVGLEDVKKKILDDIKESKSAFVFCEDDISIRSFGNFIHEKGYTIQLINLEDLEHSQCYNPLVNLKSDIDVLEFSYKLMDFIVLDENKKSDVANLLSALILYLIKYRPKEEQNFTSVIKLLRATKVDENNPSAKSPLDRLFDEVKRTDPKSIALKQYMTFKMNNRMNLSSIIHDCTLSLNIFKQKIVKNLTIYNEINFNKKNTITFIIYHPENQTLNLLYKILRYQIFCLKDEYIENEFNYKDLFYNKIASIFPNDFDNNIHIERICTRKKIKDGQRISERKHPKENEEFEEWHF